MSTSTLARPRPRRGDERGQAAGIETVPLGVLVFVAGVLMVVNVWAVLDHRAAVDDAASAYLRAYTAAPSRDEAHRRGLDAARRSLGDRVGAARELEVDAPPEAFGPCRVATVRVRLRVPVARVPFLGDLGRTTVEASGVDLVQPFGAVDLPAADRSLAGTVCDG